MTVGVEEGWPCAVKPCKGTPWQHGRVSDDREAVAVPLTCVRWRGRLGEASGVSELAREGR